MTFDDAIDVILKYEGGYANNPKDPGGETNFGISKAAYPNVDIKNLTVEHAKEIYKKDYWEFNKIDSFPYYIRLAFFDCAVNQGSSGAKRFLQNCLNVTADGVIGPITMKAMHSANGENLLNGFLLRRMQHYMSLATWPTFGLGWTSRILDVAIVSGKNL